MARLAARDPTPALLRIDGRCVVGRTAANGSMDLGSGTAVHALAGSRVSARCGGIGLCSLDGMDPPAVSTTSQGQPVQLRPGRVQLATRVAGAESRR
ncbi:hypothetical protein, partial [Bacillus sp. SIMBA_005]|uniref:hypothetical protein n=1 Tax=Bacillus sp. SIMBA_005 TaxID=3085754 RepID=UPI00397AA267